MQSPPPNKRLDPHLQPKLSNPKQNKEAVINSHKLNKIENKLKGHQIKVSNDFTFEYVINFKKT